MEFSNFGHPVDQMKNLLAEDGFNHLRRKGGVLEGIVEEGRYETVGVHTHLGQDHRDIQGMFDIGIP